MFSEYDVLLGTTIRYDLLFISCLKKEKYKDEEKGRKKREEKLLFF